MSSQRYGLVPTKYYSKKFKKLVQNNTSLLTQAINVYNLLMENPFHIKLRTHKVNSKIGQKCYNSSITGDIRIIWNFDEDKIQIIDLLDIGGHSGKNGVY
jgi:mRNA-degrading endonuclease YafQ of YafQ-DinJ toxin-antitoxin module